ncbi:hypothetical protein OH764_00825 [Burkholderia sp. M6-3]
MSPDLKKRLTERCPEIFAGQERTGAVMWFDLIDTLCAQLRRTTANGLPQVTTWQVMEKLGGLRFQVQPIPERFEHGMIEFADGHEPAQLRPVWKSWEASGP